jgi:hypothetical protein
MIRQDLIETAAKLQQPDAEVVDEFASKADLLAAELNRRMLARPDLERLVGKGNELMMQDNSRNFTRFMSSLFHWFRPEVLVDTSLWVFRAYRSHGFHTTYWPANIDTFVEILKEEMSPRAYAVLCPFYDWLIVNIPAFVAHSDAALAEHADDGPAPSHEIK